MRRQLYQSLRDGLVGAWSPAAQGRTIGATGTLLPDLSGRGKHGTLTNMDPATDWVTTGGYPALDFDGSNDYVNLGNPPALQITGDLSISVWYSINVLPVANATMLCAKDHATLGRAYTFDIAYDSLGAYSPAGNRCARFYINGGGANENNGSNIIGGNTNLVINTMYNSLGVYDIVGTLDLYLNGKSDETQRTGGATSISSTTGNVTIARREYAGFEGYHNGRILEVLIWARPLLPAEALHNYHIGPGGLFAQRRKSVGRSAAAAAPSNTGRFFQLFD